MTAETNPFQKILNELNYTARCQEIAGPAYYTDPWSTLGLARQSIPEKRFECIVDIFVRNRPRTEEELRTAIGNEALDWLLSRNILVLDDNSIRSRFCLLSCFRLYLLIDWPVITPAGRYVSSDTYLASSTYDCAREAVKRQPKGRALDLGCGSGLIVMLLAQTSELATGIDIDPVAIRLTQLNLELNCLKAAILESDLTMVLESTSVFDIIFVNPTWRIIPYGIQYPNPVARVGRGEDGLDQVRQILNLLPSHIAPGGEAIMRFDMPVGLATVETLRGVLGTGCNLEFRELNAVSIERQSEISADTCAHLNKGIPNLKERFLEHYKQIEVSELVEVECILRGIPLDSAQDAAPKKTP